MSRNGIADTAALLTLPDIHDNQIVFTAEGDLWIADITTGEARRITRDPGIETNAHFSPDGTTLAFTAYYDGGADVYVMPITGGTPKRVTYDTGDGSTVLGWTPDGKSILFTSNSRIYAPANEQEMTRQLFSVPASGGQPNLLPVPRATFAALSPDGQNLTFVPASNFTMSWFRYEAGRADKIWLTNLTTGKFTRLTDSKWVDTQPVWVGKSIFFASERSGVRNLWKLDPATRKTTQMTFSNDLPVRYLSTDGRRIVFQLGPRLEVFDPATGSARVIPVKLHSDRVYARLFDAPVSLTGGAGIGPAGKRVALVSRGHLLTVPAREGAVHSVVSDSNQRVQNPAWSPDGKQIAYISDATGEEQLYLTVDSEAAKPVQLTTKLTGEHGTPVWSPDGKYLLLGNREGEIQLIDAATGAISATIARSFGELGSGVIQNDFCFSADSKWAAYSSSLRGRTATVFLYNIAAGKSAPVSDPAIDSFSPAFSVDGQYLFMLQSRSISQVWTLNTGRMNYDYAVNVTAFALTSNIGTPFKQEEGGEIPATGRPASNANASTRIDLSGIQTRFFEMRVPAGKYTGLLALPGRLLLQTSDAIQVFDIETAATTVLAKNAQWIELSRDRNKLLVSSAGSPAVIDPGGSAVSLGASALKLDGLTVTIDPIAEWHQIFLESWRVARDFFYDPNMHGVDWQEVRSRYEAQLTLVASRYDLTLITRDMISELNAGHTAAGALPEFQIRPGRAGLLGIDLVWDAAASAYKIQHILRGDAWNPEVRSPLAEPGFNINEGDYILKLRGVALTKDQDPEALLLGTAGHLISVTTGSTPNIAMARTINIKPIPSERELRTQDWINNRRQYVEKASGGRIAYICLSDMAAIGARQWAQSYFPNVDKPGLIIDVRGNGGGNISGNILDDLASRITGFFSYRAGVENYRREGWARLGQVTALANEWTWSDGDYFCEGFKRLKIGPLVGHRTGGGAVGSNLYQLVDGGIIAVPNYAAWVPGEWIIEGRGAVPDVEIEQDPAAVMAGKDPQLDKAIEVTINNMSKHPFEKPSHPPFPIKRGGSRGG